METECILISPVKYCNWQKNRIPVIFHILCSQSLNFTQNTNQSYYGNQSDAKCVSSWIQQQNETCIKKCEKNLLNTMCHIWLSFINGKCNRKKNRNTFIDLNEHYNLRIKRWQPNKMNNKTTFTLKCIRNEYQSINYKNLIGNKHNNKQKQTTRKIKKNYLKKKSLNILHFISTILCLQHTIIIWILLQEFQPIFISNAQKKTRCFII